MGGRLTPDFKTIADFRKDNSKALQSVCREFVLLCRKLNLFTEAFVAIDGSKCKAVINRNRNFNAALHCNSYRSQRDLVFGQFFAGWTE